MQVVHKTCMCHMAHPAGDEQQPPLQQSRAAVGHSPPHSALSLSGQVSIAVNCGTCTVNREVRFLVPSPPSKGSNKEYMLKKNRGQHICVCVSCTVCVSELKSVRLLHQAALQKDSPDIGSVSCQRLLVLPHLGSTATHTVSSESQYPRDRHGKDYFKPILQTKNI